jgi:hypothetical protein
MQSLDTAPETMRVNVLKVGERFTANAEPSRPTAMAGRCRDWMGTA